MNFNQAALVTACIVAVVVTASVSAVPTGPPSPTPSATIKPAPGAATKAPSGKMPPAPSGNVARSNNSTGNPASQKSPAPAPAATMGTKMNPPQAMMTTRGQCYKTFYGRKLRLFIIS